MLTGDLRVVIAGGGTGGHVVPALAIARELRGSYHAEITFVGTARGLETRLVPEAGFSLELMRVGQLKGVSHLTRARTLADLPLGVRRCFKLLRALRPHVVIGVGGYASGPTMMAAILRRTPTLAFEPNSAPGLASRLVGRWTREAAISFEEARSCFRSAELTGIPVRPDFFMLEPRSGPARRLLVFGGSQGAAVLNDLLPRIATRLMAEFPRVEIVHQTGARQITATRTSYDWQQVPMAKITVTAYLDDMVEQFRAADLILCRSGASTLAELAAAGRPSLLVPFPQATDNHQLKNALAFAAVGAAEVVEQRELTEERLLATLRGLLKDESRRLEMGAAARMLARPDAAREIARMAVRLAGFETAKDGAS